MYDAAGQRVRKVAVASGTVKEGIYLGGYEIYRERAAAPGAVAGAQTRKSGPVARGWQTLAPVLESPENSCNPARERETRRRSRGVERVADWACRSWCGRSTGAPFGSARYRKNVTLVSLAA
jgi:hypothetical protein